MRQRVQFLAPILFLALVPVMAMPQPHERTDSFQSYSQEIPKPTGVAYKQSSFRPTWNLKYKSGSLHLKAEQWLKAEFLPGESGEKHATAILSIVPDQIRAIYFDPKAQKNSEIAERMSRSGCSYAKDRMPNGHAAPASEMLMIWLASPAPVLRAAERINRRHALRLVWRENGTDRQIVITVNDCEYASFLASLRWFVGPRWTTLGRPTR